MMVSTSYQHRLSDLLAVDMRAYARVLMVHMLVYLWSICTSFEIGLYLQLCRWSCIRLHLVNVLPLAKVNRHMLAACSQSEHPTALCLCILLAVIQVLISAVHGHGLRCFGSFEHRAGGSPVRPEFIAGDVSLRCICAFKSCLVRRSM